MSNGQMSEAVERPKKSIFRTMHAMLLAIGLLASTLMLASPAFATYSAICTGYANCSAAGYSDAGYAAASSTSFWGMTAGHNCTNYAAFRLIQDGINASYLQGQGYAWQWGGVAQSHGISVDSTPHVGDIAWWNKNSNGSGSDGHVAYVEQVGNGYIITSEDNFGGDFHWAKLTPGGYYPTGFIHFGNAGGVPLWFVKTYNTGSGHVEVHNATSSSNYSAASVHAATWISTGDQNNGWFQMVGSTLYFIKTKNTGSGHVEIHTATAASGYQSGGHWATWLGTGDQSNGWFQMVGPDLWFIKTRNTGSGHVEVHNATAASGYGSASVHAATWLGTGDQSNGWFQMTGTDLWFIKTRNTGSGRVEVHTATAASGYSAASIHAASWFGTGDQNNGWFEMPSY